MRHFVVGPGRCGYENEDANCESRFGPRPGRNYDLIVSDFTNVRPPRWGGPWSYLGGFASRVDEHKSGWPRSISRSDASRLGWCVVRRAPADYLSSLSLVARALPEVIAQLLTVPKPQLTSDLEFHLIPCGAAFATQVP